MRDKKVAIMKNVNKKYKFKKKRITSLVRVDSVWLRVLKEEARRNEMTISKTIDYLCLDYFGRKARNKINRKY